ncbi:hypothetical protein JAAARDRAFT_536166 [Jaapia argillacea MUCL 33604]|uniref:Uncharacterized protein n=1 Tax=Jaapia argillacea MUCL 33604 TaxID=933084 RepID=A0A067PBP5_9AGAM|nr:hypothetical protein JAAARDRAFT_536166 [Jaapia argillacea MUCL 33604]
MPMVRPLHCMPHHDGVAQRRFAFIVHPGKSGLKFSKIILGPMRCGSTEWAEWVLGDEDELMHVKQSVRPVFSPSMSLFSTIHAWVSAGGVGILRRLNALDTQLRSY